MSTFLPFSPAVKARTRSFAMCAALLGASCVSRRAARNSEGPPAAGSLPAPDAGGDARQSALHTATARTPSDQVPVPVANGEVAALVPAAPEVTLELPYPINAHPRVTSPMQAAAEDEALARWNEGGSGDPTYPSSQASYHPGTRVVVDTRLAKHRASNPLQVAPKHGLTLERVQAQTRSHGYWPFRLCFEAGQHEKKSDGGETRVAFTVGVRGKVSRAWLLDSKLGNAASAACLLRETGKLEFTPRPARPLALVASIRIWPGDAELPTLPEPGAAVVPAGDFDAEAVRARVASKLNELIACFADARRADPALWGRLALAAVLEVDGTVHRISEVESHFPNSGATRCAQVLLAGVVFPSVHNKPFTVVLPLRLSPPVPTTATGPDLSPSPSEPVSDAGGD